MQLLLIMNDSSQAEKDESKPLIQCRHRIRKQSAKVSAFIGPSKAYCYQQPHNNCTTSCIDETKSPANSFGDTFNQSFSLKSDSKIVDCNGNQRSAQVYPKLKARRGLYRRKRNPNANDSRRIETRSNTKDDSKRSDCPKGSDRYVRQQQYFGSGLNFHSGSYQYWQDVEKVWRCEEGDPRLRFERILRHSRRQARDKSMMDDLCDFIILIFKAIVAVFKFFLRRNNRVDVDNPKTSTAEK
ncbi:unnamed protein product [Orchesella dallaii]|uniref:Uncharacterized protein n=1 Tax=Orchesella dallaii TaxID=48710 RepID=A0ABP1QY94_9HEXA